jgi:hypothetical protein
MAELPWTSIGERIHRDAIIFRASSRAERGISQTAGGASQPTQRDHPRN